MTNGPNWTSKHANASFFLKIHRLVNHLNFVEINRYRPPGHRDTLDMRVMYLSHDITEERFKQKLQQVEKKREKTRDVHNIYTMFSHTSTDVLRQFINEPAKVDEFRDIMEQLRTYTNETFEKIRHRYGGVVPYISETWELS